MQAIFSSLEEEWGQLPLERGMRDNLPRIKKILGCTNPAVKAFLKETLYMFFAISDSTMSRALVLEDKGIQKRVYYVNHSMNSLQT